MMLDDWLYKEGLQTKEFAKVLNISRQYLSTVICGRLSCGKKIAQLIEEKTNGEVTAKEMLEDWKKMRMKPKDRT